MTKHTLDAALEQAFYDVADVTRGDCTDSAACAVTDAPSYDTKRAAAEEMLAGNPADALAHLLALLPDNVWVAAMQDRAAQCDDADDADDDTCRGCGRIVAGCAGECSTCFQFGGTK